LGRLANRDDATVDTTEERLATAELPILDCVFAEEAADLCGLAELVTGSWADDLDPTGVDFLRGTSDVAFVGGKDDVT
jgi:hypothetical protein